MSTEKDALNWTPVEASIESLGDMMLWGHASCPFDNYRSLLVFGGYGRHRDSLTKKPARLNQLFVITTGQYNTLSVKHDSHAPEPRVFSTMQLVGESTSGSTFYMFGGRASPGRVFTDLWQLNLTKEAGGAYTASWTLLSTEAPFTSTRHQSIYYRNKLFVFDSVNPLLVFCNGKWSKPRTCPELHFATSRPFTATLWRDKVYLIGHHNVQLDLNTLACKPLQIYSQGIELPVIKYHTAMPIDTTCWHATLGAL